MAKATPGQFIRQVRQEISKVTWPTRKETGISVGLVFVFCTVMGIFFMVVDKILSFGIALLFG